MTSHDVVNRVRRITRVKRVGHGGTLDPLAEGVLIIAVGRENTKQLDKYVKGDKEYIATLKLGYTSETDDREGPIYEYYLDKKIIPKVQDIKKCIKKFTGIILQTPPVYSAIKIQGKPAHRRIRKGQKIELKSREVFIKSINIVSYEYPLIELKIECGKGVYIRSLAKDIGQCLKTGAYLTKLVRTKVGEFKLEDSLNIEELKIQ